MKKIVAILIVAVMALSLVACVGKLNSKKYYKWVEKTITENEPVEMEKITPYGSFQIIPQPLSETQM